MKSKTIYIALVAILGFAFLLLFIIVVVPALIVDKDIMGAFLAGFANPYSSGYSYDVIVTWALLATWIAYESPRIKYGWFCLVLGVVPGVAMGFATYLIIREYQIKESSMRKNKE